ncbi:choline dehydrogenase [Colletotrichum orchidophilum]|uniref:Choline dehydrogenase n=1 Tax=Colletotrichum orchidophilum TaxID=1209926 RepID=A0A1G4AZ08_9PEZI|nr:choline dehydrogenase [Colletotrichum orchidophilum]OHE94384.1 choline dehydrogenase [Colletotrichum orchidophilum]
MEIKDFDVIIIGGGTAGCVLASRLSIRQDLRVLLLEAGSDRNDDEKVTTPLLSRRMFGDPNYDWCSESSPQKGLNGRVFQHTRGKMLGGSSGINSHSLVFPNKAMHEAWAEISGDDGWGWKKMRNYYRAFQTEQAQSISKQGLRNEGPIQASSPKELHILQKAWQDVFEDLGATSVADGPSGEALGGFTTTNAIDSRPGQGVRSFAGNAYLQPTLNRKNLVVITGAEVEKIVFEDDAHGNEGRLRAVGVIYEKAQRSFLVRANKEVIVCAGAVGSPKILEQSGIGNQQILEPLGIQCLVNLPGVGENLQDHLNFGPSVEVRPEIATMDISVRDPKVAAAQRAEYDENRTGPLAEGAAYSFAHWPLQLFNSQSEETALRELLRRSAHVGDEATKLQYEFIDRMILDDHEASATVFTTRIQRYTSRANPAPGNYMTIIAMLSHPYSRGSCHIETPNWHDQPHIDCAYLSHPLDVEILARHVLQIERLWAQDALSGLQRKGGNRLPTAAAPQTIEEIKEAIRGFGATNYHLCGTCAMMKDDLKDGVVNGELLVRGTTNLRVCDASIFPIIPRGNILSTVYAVAEKASAFLLETYSSRH